MSWDLPLKTSTPPGAAPKSSWAVKVARCWAALTGTVWLFGGSSVPTGWLACDGASLLRADYPDLFAAIGTTYGSADGTHFNVPDLRGRCVVGTGTGSGLSARTRAATGGAETHAVTAAQLGSHVHMQNRWSTGSGGNADGTATDKNATPADTQLTDATGGGSAHQNMQPFAVVTFCIKA